MKRTKEIWEEVIGHRTLEEKLNYNKMIVDYDLFDDECHLLQK